MRNILKPLNLSKKVRLKPPSLKYYFVKKIVLTLSSIKTKSENVNCHSNQFTIK